MTEPAAARRKTALVVEDDVWVRQLEADFLSSEGFLVLEASNGWSALRLATQHLPDVLLLDLQLPERSGLDVLQTLAQDPRTARIPVVVASAYPEQALGQEGRHAVGFVQKPFSLDALLNEVVSGMRRARVRAAQEPVPPVRARTRGAGPHPDPLGPHPPVSTRP